MTQSLSDPGLVAIVLAIVLLAGVVKGAIGIGLTVPPFKAVDALCKTASSILTATHDTVSIFEAYRRSKQ